MLSKCKANEISITRIYSAKVKDLWEAWVDPKQVSQWWGPRGFTITTGRKDVRTGGDWLYTMHGPDGIDYPNHTRFLDVQKHKLLVYDHGGFENNPPLFRVTVLFTELNEKTKMEMTMALPTPEAAEETRKIIKKANGNTTWDRLEEYLIMKSIGKEIFIINRTFNTDINKLYEIWTNPQHIMNWMAPTGFTGKYITANIKTGGESFYSMSNNDFTMYGKAHYKELRKPNQIIYTQEFVDKGGNPSRHPLAPTWPQTMLTTVNFESEDTNNTRLTIQWEVYGDATQEEHNTFNNAKSSMTQGWTGSLDKLEEYLKN